MSNVIYLSPRLRAVTPTVVEHRSALRSPRPGVPAVAYSVTVGPEGVLVAIPPDVAMDVDQALELARELQRAAARMRGVR